MIVIAATIVGSAPSIAQPARPPAVAAGTAQIGGIVKSASDDKPLARARVVASSQALPQPRAAITGADGRYTLTDLPSGSYTVSATRTGFAPQAFGQGRDGGGRPIAVAGAQRVDNIDFALAPGGLIVGRILDEDGSPFAGAIVEALVTRSESGAETLVTISTGQTDDRGEFRLFGLAAGEYYVSAEDPAFRNISTPTGVQHYSPTYYPGTPAADQARRIVVSETGDPARVEFRLKLVPPSRVRGQLMAYNGKELLSGSVVMSPLSGEGVPTAPPDDISIKPDGRFVFGQVAPGNYEIRARGVTDTAGTALFAVFSTDVLGRDIGDIRMTLRPGAILAGTVTADIRRGTKPPPLTTLRVRAPFTDGNGFGDALTGSVQADGTFALRGVMKGAHQIVVDGLLAPWMLKSVSLHGSDITDVQIDLSEKQQVRDVRITISDESGVVRGTVENARNRPVPNATVLVFSSSPLFWLRTSRRLRSTYTDEEGRFIIPGLPPGEYLAIASLALDESDLGRRGRLESLLAQAMPFRLTADEATASVALRVTAPAATVRAVR